jgi:hypothetical protein
MNHNTFTMEQVLGGRNKANRNGITTENLSCRIQLSTVNQDSQAERTVRHILLSQISPRMFESDSGAMTQDLASFYSL